jgi:hypothetical protein
MLDSGRSIHFPRPGAILFRVLPLNWGRRQRSRRPRVGWLPSRRTNRLALASTCISAAPVVRYATALRTATASAGNEDEEVKTTILEDASSASFLFQESARALFLCAIRSRKEVTVTNTQQGEQFKKFQQGRAVEMSPDTRRDLEFGSSSLSTDLRRSKKVPSRRAESRVS